MDKYASLIRTDDENSYAWKWAGISRGESVQDAAVALAVSCAGYDEDEFETNRELVEQFIEDGWRFRLLRVEEDYTNDELW